MKSKIILTTMFFGLSFFGYSQREFAFFEGVKKKKIIKENVSLTLTTNDESPTVTIKGVETGAEVAGKIVNTAFDLGVNLLEKYLENREKSFSSEYVANGINPNPFLNKLPELIFEWNITAGELKNETALKLKLIPHLVESTYKVKVVDPNDSTKTKEEDRKYPLVLYKLDSLLRKASKARITSNWQLLDYTVVIKLRYLEFEAGQFKEEKEIELGPISLKKIGFEEETFTGFQHTTKWFVVPNNAFLIGADMTITETNPKKVKAEKVLQAWKDHNSKAKDVLQLFLPSDESDDTDGGSEDGKKPDGEKKDDETIPGEKIGGK